MGEFLVHALEMRQEMTPPERALWAALRGRGLSPRTFRRQYVIERFIVDICCPAASLIVEGDGETHADPTLEAVRTAWLDSEGLPALRFWNNEVMPNLDLVLQVIPSACGDAPPPHVGGGSPRGE